MKNTYRTLLVVYGACLCGGVAGAIVWGLVASDWTESERVSAANCCSAAAASFAIDWPDDVIAEGADNDESLTPKAKFKRRHRVFLPRHKEMLALVGGIGSLFLDVPAARDPLAQHVNPGSISRTLQHVRLQI